MFLAFHRRRGDFTTGEEVSNDVLYLKRPGANVALDGKSLAVPLI